MHPLKTYPALMAAHCASPHAHLQRAGPQQTVPASSAPCAGQRAARLPARQFRRQTALLPRSPVLRWQAPLSSTTIVAASSYENGFGAVGKHDGQPAAPVMGTASPQAPAEVPAPQPVSVEPAAEPGAPTSSGVWTLADVLRWSLPRQCGMASLLPLDKVGGCFACVRGVMLRCHRWRCQDQGNRCGRRRQQRHQPHDWQRLAGAAQTQWLLEERRLGPKIEVEHHS